MAEIHEELRRQMMTQLQGRRDSGMPVTDIANRLDVRPATVYQLLLGATTPTAKVLCNACRNLKMFFEIDGHRITAVDFPLQPERPPTTEVQIGLFEMTASSTDDELNVSVTNKKTPNTELRVTLHLAG
jgi:transcriptional regulator with XRE-family HTH domain